MTPERKAEMDKNVAWWRRQMEIRTNGFDIECNDPLFAPRAPIPEPEPIMVLWCRCWLHTWMKFEKDFTFTGRIKYTHLLGKFDSMAFEITWQQPEKLWQNLWRQSYKTRTYWANYDNFEWRDEVIVSEYEDVIVDNGEIIVNYKHD